MKILRCYKTKIEEVKYMKVKIIKADDVWDLEMDINNFLNTVSDSQIIDIKYQGVGNHPTSSLDRPSAMIIMK